MQLDHATSEFHHSLAALLREKQHELEKLTQRLHQQNPAYRLKMQQQQLTQLRRRMFAAVATNIGNARKSLGHAAGMLDAVSPLATLGRGYALAKTPPPESRVIRDVNHVQVGDPIEVTLQKGWLACRVEQKVENGMEEKRLRGNKDKFS